MATTNWNRRQIIKAGAASFAAPLFIPSEVLGNADVAPPSESVRVGIIGCGPRARMIREGDDVKGFKVVAVCDCLKQRAIDYAAELSRGEQWGVYDDFRKMIEEEQLDAVMVETTTHARAWVTILAMQMGMDVYIEKPMCLTIEEGRAMVNAARKFNRVTQVGTQQRSMPINNWARDLVKNGAIGKITTVIAPNFLGPYQWKGTAKVEDRTTVEPWWDMWTNQAELRPYDRSIHHGWARWADYDAGGLCFGVSGWGTHSYDQVNRALGTDETGPVEVLLEEEMKVRDSGKFAPQESVGGVTFGLTGDVDTGTGYYHLSKLAGPRAKVTMTFENGTKLKLHLDGDRGPGLGAIFVGENGKIEINRNKIASNPKELSKASDNPGPNRRPETAYHIEDWINCIKSRERCTADIEYGQRSSTLCSLVNIVRDVNQVGKPLRWDPNAEQFTNCDEANQMLSRPRRKGFELPELS